MTLNQRKGKKEEMGIPENNHNLRVNIQRRTSDMEISEIRNLCAVLQKQILNLLNNFEEKTTVKIERIDISRPDRIGGRSEIDIVRIKLTLNE